MEWKWFIVVLIGMGCGQKGRLGQNIGIKLNSHLNLWIFSHSPDQLGHNFFYDKVILLKKKKKEPPLLLGPL